MHSVTKLLEPFFGTSEGRQSKHEALRLAGDLPARIRDVNERWPIDPSSAPVDSPVFIFSAGWRSGSTLLQRMIMSDRSVIIWGEPFDRAEIIQSLAYQWRGFTKTWPFDDFMAPTALASPSDDWIANLYPEVEALWAGQIALLQRLFAYPAHQRGYERWGVKEVRLMSDHALLLKWLYPQAKFLFLYRDPIKAYASYKPWRRWFRRWPHQPILTPRAFGHMWRDMVEDYRANHRKVGGMLIRYEDLQTHVPALRDYLELNVTAPEDLRIERGGRGDGKQWVSSLEHRIIKSTTSPTREWAGYS